MEITDHSSRQSLVRWAERVRTLVAAHDDAGAIGTIDQALAQYRAETFQLAVIGKAKRGKSTLINALLGRRDDLVAPIDRLPASSAITRFSWSERESATVVHRDGRRQAIAYEQVRQYATEEANPGNAKGVDLIEVTGPFPGLERDLVLVDTPGAGSLHEYHDALLHGFIPRADAVIFLTTVRMPLDRDELELLHRVRAADVRKIAFAINMMDKVDGSRAGDVEDAVTHNLRLLAEVGLTTARLYRISGKRAYEGDLAGSGVGELAAEIARFLAESKGNLLDANLVARVDRSARPVLLSLEAERAAGRLSADRLDAELRDLDHRRQEILARRKATEEIFLRQWNQALNEFESGLSVIKLDVIQAVHGRINAATILGVGALKKDLPTAIVRTIEERLAAPVGRLDRALCEAVDGIQSSYPALDALRVGDVVLRVRGDDELASGLVKGAAMVAAGVGLSSLAAPPAPVAAAGIGARLTGYVSLSAWAYWGAQTVLTAVGGPLGLVLAGAGALTIPWAYTLSRIKLKDQLFGPTRELIEAIFTDLRAERLGALRRVGPNLLEAYQIQQDRTLREVEAGIARTRGRDRSTAAVAERERWLAELRSALAERTGDVPEGTPTGTWRRPDTTP